MSDMKQRALRVAVLAALGEQVTKAAERERADLLAVMQEVGAERVAAELPGGDQVASVTLAASKGGRAYVTDEVVFTRYVAETYPSELEYTVRPAFRKQLLEEASATGEDVPGVAFSDPRPYLMNKFKADGKDAVAAAWVDGSLPLVDLLAIEGGETAEYCTHGCGHHRQLHHGSKCVGEDEDNNLCRCTHFRAGGVS